MDVLFYHYYLFYKNVFKDGDPTLTARLALTASESLLVIAVFDITLSYFFCWSLNKYHMAGITIILLLVNTFIFFTTEKVEDMAESKPEFFQSRSLSITISWLFFLITTSSMFWLGDVIQTIISNCHK